MKGAVIVSSNKIKAKQTNVLFRDVSRWFVDRRLSGREKHDPRNARNNTKHQTKITELPPLNPASER
jgi:hypothetical protein